MKQSHGQKFFIDSDVFYKHWNRGRLCHQLFQPFIFSSVVHLKCSHPTVPLFSFCEMLIQGDRYNLGTIFKCFSLLKNSQSWIHYIWDHLECHAIPQKSFLCMHKFTEFYGLFIFLCNQEAAMADNPTRRNDDVLLLCFTVSNVTLRSLFKYKF